MPAIDVKAPTKVRLKAMPVAGYPCSASALAHVMALHSLVPDPVLEAGRHGVQHLHGIVESMTSR